jgi:hypothetical protein
MSVYQPHEACQHIIDNMDLDETDNQGQIVIYTGLFRHSDDSIHDEPETPSQVAEPCRACLHDSGTRGGICDQCGDEV